MLNNDNNDNIYIKLSKMSINAYIIIYDYDIFKMRVINIEKTVSVN